MRIVTKSEIINFIELNMRKFHSRRLNSLKCLKLRTILLRKNPYLFKAKYQNTPHELVKTILDAYLSSQEEGIFGEFLEELALFICKKVYGGEKSAAQGIDMEFRRDGTIYLVSIKSGPHWGNSRQIAKMKDDFTKAKKILGANTKDVKIICVNGCCYGKDENPDKGEYLKLCGQRFWEFISGDENLYTDIIDPLGHTAKEQNKEFLTQYTKIVNKFILEFSKEYCTSDGAILWKEIVKLNSGKKDKI